MNQRIPNHTESRKQEDLERDIREAIQKYPVEADLNISSSQRDEILERAWSEFTASRKQMNPGIKNKIGQTSGSRRWIPILGTAGVAAVMIGIFVQMKSATQSNESEISMKMPNPSSPAQSQYQNQYQLGDLNQDGALDIADALILSQKLKQENRDSALDVNGDLEFNQSDLEWTLARIVQIDG